MNWLKKIWFLYGWLSHLDRAIINAKSFNKGKEKRDSLILELVNKKKLKKEHSNLSKFLTRILWCWGIPVIIGIFAWGLFEGIIKNNEDGILNRVSPFIVIAIVSYFLGVAFKSFCMTIKVKCPKCGSFLFCSKCGIPIIEAEEDNDYDE